LLDELDAKKSQSFLKGEPAHIFMPPDFCLTFLNKDFSDEAFNAKVFSTSANRSPATENPGNRFPNVGCRAHDDAHPPARNESRVAGSGDPCRTRAT
jgi:hypothetical protein